MLEHAASQFRYFLYLEDDVALSTTAAEEILGIVQSMAKTRPNQDSISGQAIVKLCVGGMLGIIYDSRVVSCALMIHEVAVGCRSIAKT